MTQRLVSLARKEWASIDGQLASQGIDPLLLPADRFFSLLYWWATHRAEDPAAVAKFDRKLWMPPKGKAPAPGSPWSPEAETAAFGSLAAAFGVVKGSSNARQGTPPPAAPPA